MEKANSTTPANKDMSRRWPVVKTNYRLLSMQFTDDYSAVMAEECGLNEYRLVKLPLAAIGVADVTEQRFMDNGSKLTPIENATSSSDIVGLVLTEGAFEIINSYDNFAGIVKRGDRIEHATAYLKGKYIGGLRRYGTNASNPIDNA